MIEIVFVAILASVASVSFFYGRKKNLIYIRDYSRELENALNPVDKIYHWIGLYAGFRAYYTLKGAIKKVEATIVLLPRQSIFYLPISFLTLKHDRYYLVYHLGKCKCRETHLLSPEALSHVKLDFPKHKILKRRIMGKTFYVVEGGSNEYHLLRSIVEKYPNNILHVSVTPKTNVLYIYAKPAPGVVGGLARLGLRVAKELTSG